MLNLGMAFMPDLPYTPLPETARQAALESLAEHGFTSLEHYSFISLDENHPVTTNILAFAHPTHRTPDYISITIFNASGYDNDVEIVTLLSTSTAPFHLLYKENTFTLWISSIQNKRLGPKPRPALQNISVDRLHTALSEYKLDFSPQRIIDVKQGRDTFSFFRDIQPLQLSLWATDVTRPQLVAHFGSTVETLRNAFFQRDDLQGVEKERLVTTLSIQLLGALILADTGLLDDAMRRHRPALLALMLKASQAFERYFRFDLFLTYALEAEKAYDVLQRICYASFSPDMLKELYKTAYGKKERKESGSYDTPLYLTRHIWNQIPIENIAPEKRIVADMSCGWGSFLVAGYERLSNLRDTKDLILHNHLFGNDKEPFTAQLAGLGLLLSTSEDSWHIDAEDALQWQWLEEHQPTIIVGNPPFSGNRKKNSKALSDSEKNVREEKANFFLERAIHRLAPGGYLAMLVPSTFTALEASPRYRKQLLEQCDILELWSIPSGIFDDAMVQTTVIFAQKQNEWPKRSQYPVRVRTIQKHTLKHADEFMYTASGLVANQLMWDESSKKSPGSRNDYIMDFYTVLPEYIWKDIKAACEEKRLYDYTTIIRGGIVGKKEENKRWKDYPNPKLVPWLAGVKNVMPPDRPFFLNYAAATTITYPNDLEEPRKSEDSPKDKEHILAGKKVLVPYNTNPNWGRRLRAVIENRGCYVSDHFYAITPTIPAQERFITHEVFAAILNWDIGNAWVVEHLKGGEISKRVIDSIPFPDNLTREDCQILTEAVHQFETAAFASQTLPEEALLTIDAVLKRAYHLDDATFARLRQIKEWTSYPQITLDPLPDSKEANWSLSGVVESVHTGAGTITLHLSGFDEPQTVQIVPPMPGWMLRPGATFFTKIPRKYIKDGIIPSDNINWGTFYPQQYTYMTDEDLFAELANILQEDKRHRV